eukprot:gene8247-16964_t
MSWGSSNYDDNPFAESRSPIIANSRSTDTSKPAPPPWLQDSQIESHGRSGTGGNDFSASAPAATDQKAEVDQAIPNLVLYTRVINLVLSGCIIVASLLSLLTTASITTGVLACYVMIFACLICCYETHLKQVSKIIALNFGFMYSAKHRCVFILFVGIILFNFSIFGKIVGACMFANAFYNGYIIFRYPEYEEFQKKDAQAEIQDFLASNPAFAQQLVTAGVSASAAFAAKNPGMVKKGAEAYMQAKTESPAGTSV